MLFPQSLIVGTLSIAAALAVPLDSTSVEHEKRSEVVTASTTGTYGGYWFSNYVESNTGSTLTLNGNSYSLQWTTAAQDVVAGIGWQTGAARTINYSGSLSATGDSLIALYGWTTSPLVEYYVIEKYGTYNPGTGGTHMGTVTSDGGVYDVYLTTRTNAPSIQGTQTFHQYLSIRQSSRTSGTITFQNHITAWKNFGMNLGTWNYQIMATEGYQSSGSSSITLS